QITGTAQIERGGASIVAAVGMNIELGDRLITNPPDSRVAVALRDQSTLYVDDGGGLLFTEQMFEQGVRTRTRLDVLRGRVRAVVSSAIRDNNPNFEVHTPNAIVGVRGTDFFVGYSEGDPELGAPTKERSTGIAVIQGETQVANAAVPSS